MASLRTVALPWSALVIACFSPGEDDPLTGDTGSSSSSSTNASGDPSGPADGSETSAASMDTTTADPADSSTSDGADTTTSTSECDDVSAPCPDDQYCVDNRYCDNPPLGMVAVPGGPFWMGCNEDVDTACEDDEYPYHEVTLAAFAIDRTEVTIDAYAECVSDGACSSLETTDGGGNPCNTAPGDLPVGCVDWFQANDYCEWIGGALPTEAQWEKAARGTDGRIYPWGDDPPTCAHTNMTGCRMPSALLPVGSKPAGASPYGALDLSGNVFEWVADWYDAAYYVDSPDSDPPGPDQGSRRIIRSAAYNYGEPAQRASFRGVDFEVPTPEGTASHVGFRCAYVP